MQWINKYVIRDYKYIGWQTFQCICFLQVGHSTKSIRLPSFLTFSKQVEQNMWPHRVDMRFCLAAFISVNVHMHIGQVGSSITGAGGGVSTRFSTTLALVDGFLFC